MGGYMNLCSHIEKSVKITSMDMLVDIISNKYGLNLRHGLHINRRACTHQIHTHACTYIHTHVQTHTHIYIHMHLYTHAQKGLHIYTYIRTHTFIHAHCEYIYIHTYHIYPTPPLGQDMTHGQFFKRSLTGLNSEFSFS